MSHNLYMEDNLIKIKSWLKTGSINIFGLPMSGKDTAGTRLAEALSAEFLSSGSIIRKMEAETAQNLTEHGALIPSDLFYDWVLPYFGHSSLEGKPLVLSSVGRWSGEETAVLEAAKKHNHEIKAAVLLDLTEEDVKKRWHEANEAGHRVGAATEVRKDDADPETFETRIKEFHEKTAPVLEHYENLGLLVKIDANGTRDEVFERLVNALVAKSADA